VRVGHGYGARFTTHHGQRNAVLVPGPLTPLVRLDNRFDSVALLEPGYDLIHSINAVPIFTRTPFILTFEDFLPRTPEDRPIPWLEYWLLRRLSSPRCLAIIGMSQYAIRQFKRQHKDRAELPGLLAKCHVIPPGVAPTRTEPKLPGDRLRLLFVGADYFRKGGPALVRAHRALRNAGIPVETTVVSALCWSPKDYIGPPDEAGVASELREIDTEGVTLHRGLPNDAVRKLMAEADYLVFPTLHDTFGYVSLEALAAGTPVIATATCVQPEIVEDGRSGFLLPFDNDAEIGKWRWIYGHKRAGYVDAYWQTIRQLTEALTERLSQCWENRPAYEELSAGALARINTSFHSDHVRARLEQLYERARPN
jgi:glycosyltransferase involved in cell wall biosynthesis